MKTISMLARSLAASLALGAVAAGAVPIVGTANLSFGLVTVSFGEIDWNPPLNPGLDLVPTYGSFLTQDVANTGVFAGPSFAGVTGGFVQDMSANPADANFVPIGAGFTDNFLRFTVQPGWTFDVTNLSAGTIPGTPYALTQVDNNVSATITVNGFACDTGGDGVCNPGDDVTSWTGIFSAQYTNTTIAALQATILGGGTLDNNTWSGTIEATATPTQVPEPTSLALVGLALAGLGFAARRRKA